jgi:light-regulated signal transduction histidine kinase (bacteriophytochrome)
MLHDVELVIDDAAAGSPLLDAQSKIVVHQRNIDTRKAGEEERKRHAEELERCNVRLEQFAYTAAHDLWEPLREISSYTEMLVQETQMDANTRQMAQFIVDAMSL